MTEILRPAISAVPVHDRHRAKTGFRLLRNFLFFFPLFLQLLTMIRFLSHGGQTESVKVALTREVRTSNDLFSNISNISPSVTHRNFTMRIYGTRFGKDRESRSKTGSWSLPALSNHHDEGWEPVMMLNLHVNNSGSPHCRVQAYISIYYAKSYWYEHSVPVSAYKSQSWSSSIGAGDARDFFVREVNPIAGNEYYEYTDYMMCKSTEAKKRKEISAQMKSWAEINLPLEPTPIQGSAHEAILEMIEDFFSREDL